MDFPPVIFLFTPCKKMVLIYTLIGHSKTKISAKKKVVFELTYITGGKTLLILYFILN